ncbi:hypothetical protein SAMN05421870_11117 [Streptomyces qinglanensis]|uniref:Uncharacterized protein n=1 Tax=Streptomyces qinglanensis TaxID=943816 RepID=A0A1H9V943_9ACTN|nr:hypothetical protein SAMN05421870_11117 [Streptomyces qinglanensis]
MSEAGPSKLSVHRRPLATAAAAGGVLLALGFVPTANATPEKPEHPTHHSNSVTRLEHAGGAAAE